MPLGKASDIGKAVSQRFGPLVNLLGSATAVSALLLALGFLSDFGAYRVASLPRLHFSLTALAETGAEVLIDTAALILASPWRALLMVCVLVALIVAWALRDQHPRIRRLACSVSAYRAVRLLSFVFAVLLSGSVIDRIQMSLAGDDRTASALNDALRGAYAGHFPDPWEREFAIERKTYELRFFPFPNIGARLDRAWGDVWNAVEAERTGFYWLKSGDGEEEISGIPLRQLPETRYEARQVFGWVSLAVVFLVMLNALLRWWGGAVGDTTRAESEDASPKTSPDAGAAEHKDVPAEGNAIPQLEELGWLNRGKWIQLLRLDGWAAPIERLLAPLTVFMTGASIMLLPLLHGVLARTTLGAETVMVFLVDEDGAKSVESSDKGKGAPHAGGCSSEALETIKSKEKELDNALRIALQAHPAHEESESKEARQSYKAKAKELAESVLAAECADAVALMWSARPSMGVSVGQPDLAEFFWSQLRHLSRAYNVQIGVILSYPRKDQPLVLANTIVAPWDVNSGQWGIVDLQPEQIASIVVLPKGAESLRREVAELDAQVRANSSHDSIPDILVKPGEQSFEVVLKLLKDGVLNSNPAGVGVTTLGSMAYVTSRDRPRLTTEAIDLLVDLAKAGPSTSWPRKSPSLRGAAVTSLLLSRSPYAAYRLAEALDQESGIKDCKPKPGAELPLRCIRQTPTAAGFLMDTLAAEGRYQNGTPSSVLTQTQGRLLDYLVDVVSIESFADDGVRGAACTAMQLAGKLRGVTDAQRGRYMKTMITTPFAKAPSSMGACILAMWSFGFDGGEQRAWLRNVASGHHEWVGEKSGLTATDKDLIQVAALSVLVKQGIAGEEQLIFGLYVSPDETSDLNKLVMSLLDETSAPDMAALFLQCGEDQAVDSSRRVRCLRGLGQLHPSFRGDELRAVERVRDLANDGDDSVQQAACSVLRVFGNRGSKWLLRNGEKDATVQRCLKVGMRLDDLLNGLPDPLRKELEQKLKQLSPDERAEFEAKFKQRSESQSEEEPAESKPSKAF